MLLASEPVVQPTTTSYTDVMNYLHSIRITREDKERVAKRLALESSGQNLSRAYSRLDYLSTLQSNWDGEGALPVSRSVIRNLKAVLLVSDDSDWDGWLIGPDSNATLCLQSKQTNACMSIGAKEYSYYARVNGKRYGESHVAFTPEAFLSTLREIG